MDPVDFSQPEAETGEIALAAAHFAGLEGGTASRPGSLRNGAMFGINLGAYSTMEHLGMIVYECCVYDRF